MLYLYLDESGDLGFDFVTKKPSKFFTVTVLAVYKQEQNKALINAVRRTLKRKLGKRLKNLFELKGSNTSLDVKKYFYRNLAGVDFILYALTLDKRRLYPHLCKEKERIYNYIARLVMRHISFENVYTSVELVVDKSKSKPEIEEFNSYIIQDLKGRINPKVALFIDHYRSHENFGLQAVDMFAWGIFRKYEKKDMVWLNIFKSRVKVDDIYMT